MALKIATTVVNLVLAIVLARVLGPEDFGIYSLVFAIITILAIPARVGLPTLVLRETAKAHVGGQWGVMRGVWRWSSYVVLGTSAIILVLGSTFSWYWGEKIGVGSVELGVFYWSLLLLPFFTLLSLHGAALRGLRHLIKSQLPEFILRPGFLILFMSPFSVGIVSGGLSAADAMMLHAAAGSLAFAVAFFILIRVRPAQLRAHDPEISQHWKGWLASALPLALTGGIQVVNQNVGVLILGLFRTSEEVALLRIAVQGATLVAFGLAAANLVAGPHIARLYAQNDIARLQKLLTDSARLVLLIALPVAVGFIIFGRPLLAFLFGPEFVGAYGPLIALTVGQLVNAFVASVGITLNMTGHEREVTRASAVALLLTGSLTVLLAPMLGALGAAIASATSLSVWNLILWQRVRKRLGIDSAALPIGVPGSREGHV